jgi:hypothetical protein
MKTTNQKKQLAFGKKTIVELNDNILADINGGSGLINWLKDKINDGLNTITH